MRVMLCIGCDAYEHANPLTGAERDAKRVFETLSKENIGEFDPRASRLLLSPTIDEVRRAIRDVLFANKRIDTLAFYFAGHGSLHAGSFYMWLRDSTPEGLSLSALSLSDLFRSLNEAAPAQSNVIIDACESGALIADLAVLLKSELMGDAGSPGVTLVATAAKNEGAGETSEGGFGTNAILDCVEGRDFINDTASALDLIEIGRRVSDRLRNSDQSPVVWGLNLFGPRRFCRNPHYGTDPASPLRTVVQAWAPEHEALIKGQYEQLGRGNK